MLQSYFSHDVNNPQWQMDFASLVCLPHIGCVLNVMSPDGLSLCQTDCHICHTKQAAATFAE